MSQRVGEGSQSWLSGADNTLDNFFSNRASTSKSGCNASPSLSVKRNRDALARNDASKGVGGLSAKRQKTESNTDASNSRQTGSIVHDAKRTPLDKSKIGTKGKGRPALNDVTAALQNSPRRRRTAFGASTQRENAFTPSKSRDRPKENRKTKANTGVIYVSDSSSDSELVDKDASLRLRTPTLCLPRKNAAALYRTNIPTPPSSSMVPKQALARNERSSSPTHLMLPIVDDNTKRASARTPFPSATIPSKSYPTPASVVPRLKSARPSSDSTRPLPAPNLGVDSDSPLTSLSSSQTQPDDEEENENLSDDATVEKTLPRDKSWTDVVIPASQTQYIHYSPSRKKSNSINSVTRLKQTSSTVIPTSQSSEFSFSQNAPQNITLSPRKTRRPAPISSLGLVLSELSSPLRDKAEMRQNALDFVVPTSQEDEEELSLSNDAAARLSQLLKDGAIMVVTEIRDKTRPAAEVGSQLPSGDALVLRHAAKALSLSTDPARSEDQLDNSRKERPSESQLQGTTRAEYREGDNGSISGTAFSQSTQARVLNSVADRLDRLAEEIRANTMTVSQILSRPRISSLSPRKSPAAKENDPFMLEPDRCKKMAEQQADDDERSDEEPKPLLPQSSMTEPDESQWDMDPFSLTNEAYANHIGLHRRNSRSGGQSGLDRDEAGVSLTCTQSSATQTDSDDGDPFPTLPPVSTAESTADRAAVNRLLLPSPERENKDHRNPEDTRRRPQPQLQEDASHSQNQSYTENDAESQPMPGIGSSEELDMRLSTPRCVHPENAGAIAAERAGTRFRRRNDDSFVLLHSDQQQRGCQNSSEAEQESESQLEWESMPSSVLNFFRMLGSESQSQSRA